MRAMTMFGALAAVIDAQHLATPEPVTQLGAPPIRIDLLSSISGVTFEEASTDVVRVKITGETLPVIGIAALRANKQATKRRKDLDDLRHLPAAAALDASAQGRTRRPNQP